MVLILMVHAEVEFEFATPNSEHQEFSNNEARSNVGLL